eukprot:255858_1
MQTLFRNTIESHESHHTNWTPKVHIGDRVELNIGDAEAVMEYVGRVEFIGFVPSITHEVIGVNLDSAIQEGHDGKGLFCCPPKHGLFTQKQFIRRIIAHKKLGKLRNTTVNYWQKLSKFPLKDSNFSIILHRNTFITATWKDSHYTNHGLYKYDIVRNEWTKWFDYPSSTITSWHTMSFSPAKQCIYIYGKQMNLLKIDVTRNTLRTINGSFDVGNLPNSIFIDGELHIIGGQNNNKHLVWNGKQKRFRIRHTFAEFEGITGFVLVHIEAQDVVALIGGTSYKPFAILDTIYVYFIKQRIWIKYDYKLPIQMSNMSHIMSSDGRYVLLIAPIINGLNGSRRTNRIYVIDTTNMHCKQSKIFLPFKPSPCHSIRTHYNKCHHMLVCGYLRTNDLCTCCHDVVEGNEWIQIIMNYIAKKEDYLHVLQDFKPSHYRIRVSDIVNGDFCSIRKY